MAGLQAACGGIEDGAAPQVSAESAVRQTQPEAIVRSAGEDLRVSRALSDTPSECAGEVDVPRLRADIEAEGEGPSVTRRSPDPEEVDWSLDQRLVMAPVDRWQRGEALRPVEPRYDEARLAPPDEAMAYDGSELVLVWLDSDGDCLLDYQEQQVGTDPNNPDTDHDGWFDGPCNERRRLILERVACHQDQESRDEFYVIADDVRYPNSDLDDYWQTNDGDSHAHNLTVATRVRGKDSYWGFKPIRIEGWEDDYEFWNDWTADDLLGFGDVDLGAYGDGQKLTIRMRRGGSCNSCWDYTLTFRVEIDYFADPLPRQNGDKDRDGIKDRSEWYVATFDGGIAHPDRKDVFIEVDAMQGHALHINAKRLVTTQYFRHGYNMFIERDDVLPVDSCLTAPEAHQLYNAHFRHEFFRSHRYALITDDFWRGRSGANMNDMFIVCDSWWWIDGNILAQAGTFIHELGHSMSLRGHSPTANGGVGYFEGIDDQYWPSYYSAMNYTWQSVLVDYSDDSGWLEHDDWRDMTPSWGLAFQFRQNGVSDTGICGN